MSFALLLDHIKLLSEHPSQDAHEVLGIKGIGELKHGLEILQTIIQTPEETVDRMLYAVN